MAQSYKTLIDGEWIETGKTLDVCNKFTGEVFATVPVTEKAQTEKAIEAAAQAFKTFRKYPAHKRAAILEKTAQLLQERMDEVAAVICQEVGKAWKFSVNEVQRSVETFKFAARKPSASTAKPFRSTPVPSVKNRIGYYIKEPVGVIGAITPFNFPLNLIAHKVGPAIAAGNTVVVKPASSTPVSALLLAEIMEQAGLPKGVLNIVIGSGASVGDVIVMHPKVKKISFTGSPAVGDQIIRKAGIKKVSLELGNNSATMIEPDADLEKAAARCVVSAFSNSGQVCISLQRLYVHKDCIDSFSKLFIAKTKALKIGDPLEKDTDIGPMIDPKEIARIDQWVADAREAGAVVACGGKAEGSVYLPTVLTNVSADMKVVCQETFAPVVSLIPLPRPISPPPWN